jgi:hypothetical protein
LKGVLVVNENERELIKIIRESENPELVAQYMLNLFLDYLQTHAPSPRTPSAGVPESA